MLFTNHNEVQRVSIVMLPFVLFLGLSLTLIASMFLTQAPYQNNVLMTLVILALCWGSALYYHMHKSKSDEMDYFLFDHVGLAFASMLLVTYFTICTIWGSGYLSLQPLFNLDGRQHIDTLFHSAVAESFSRGEMPHYLINDELVIHYHTASHFIMYHIAQITTMPVFLVYTYLFPVIFLPLYFMAALYAICTAKKVFMEKGYLTIVDVVCMSFFVVGIGPSSWLAECGIWKSNFIISESFLIAQTISFYFYAYVLERIGDGVEKKTKKFCLIVSIPLFLMVIAGAKISVCFAVLTAVLFYLWRKYGKSWWILGITVYYGGIYYVCMKLFSEDSGALTHMVPFAFKKCCSGYIGYFMHYIVLTLMIWLVVWCLYREVGKKWSLLLKNKNFIWLELLLFVAAMCFLPGMLIDISYAAVYFSFCIEVPSLLVLCGFGYADRICLSGSAMTKYKHINIVGAAVIWLTVVIVLSAPTFPLRGLQRSGNGGEIYSQAMEIRQKVDGQQIKYAIYIADDARIMKIYNGPRSVAVPFVYPALTGVGVINGSYVHEGEFFTITGIKKRGYGFDMVNHDRLSLSEAKDRARDMGKEWLLVIEGNAYKYVFLKN